MNPGPLEILIIAVFALLVFGPKKLPELSRTVGRALAEFRRATKEFSDELTSAVDEQSEESKATSNGLRNTELRPGPRLPRSSEGREPSGGSN